MTDPRSRRCVAVARALSFAALYPLLSAHSPLPRVEVSDAAPDDRAVYAFVGTRRAELLAGRRAKIQTGDLVLGNRLVRFVIGGHHPVPGFPNFTGYLLDAGRVGKLGDLLGAATLVVDTGRGRLTASYDRVEVVSDGKDGVARVRASGYAAGRPSVRIVTEYSLREWAEHLTIETTLENRSDKAIRSARVGDYVRWTNASTFFPGKGYRLRKSQHSAGWIARRGRGSSFAWFVERGKIATTVLTSHQGSRYNTAMKIFVKRVKLPARGKVTYRRHLAVGQGDLADVARIVYEARAQPVVRVEGTVRGKRSGRGLEGVRVRAYSPRGRELISEAETTRAGRFELWLPPDKYRIVAWQWGRPDAALPVRRIDKAPPPIEITMSAPGRVEYEVRDEVSGELLPARLIFLGQGRTKNPKFVPQREDRQFDNVAYTHTGKGERNLPSGRYRVLVTRGPEYTLRELPVVIRAGETIPIKTTLKRVVDTHGYIAADFHIHSVNSQDSLVGLEDRVRSLVAENVEFAVPTDHNYVTDYRPFINAMGVKKWIASVPGNEVTTDGVRLGHFNVYPVDPEAGTPGEGAFAFYRRTPAKIFEEVRAREGWERVIQVNHPRLGRGNGYWNNTSWNGKKADTADNRYSAAFDAIEVFNGLDKTLAPTEHVMREWFALLNRGVRYTATGNSDSHRLGSEEVGYPRNFVAVDDDRPTEVDPVDVIASVRRGRVVVTNGPFLRIRVRRAGAEKPRVASVAANEKGKRNGNGRGVLGAPRPPETALAVGGMGDLVSAGTDGIHIDVEVHAAPWVDVTRVEVVGNGETVLTVPVKRSDASLRYKGTLQLRPKGDTWYVIAARGRDRLEPVLKRDVPPFGFANPFWVDADGDGRFSPPR